MSEGILAADAPASKRIYKLPLPLLQAFGCAALTLVVLKSWAHRHGGWKATVSITKLAESLGLKKRAIQLHLKTLRDAKYLLLNRALRRLLRRYKRNPHESHIDAGLADGVESILKLGLREQWAKAKELGIDVTAEVRWYLPGLAVGAMDEDGLVEGVGGKLRLNRKALERYFVRKPPKPDILTVRGMDRGEKYEFEVGKKAPHNCPFLSVPWDIAKSQLSFEQKIVLCRVLSRLEHSGTKACKFPPLAESSRLGLDPDTVAKALEQLAALGYFKWFPGCQGIKRE